MSPEVSRLTPDECVRNSELYFGQAADDKNLDIAEHTVETALDWQQLAILIQGSLKNQQARQEQLEKI